MTRNFGWDVVTYSCRQFLEVGRLGLLNFADFLVEVGESGFEGLAVLRVGGGLEVVDDSDAGELEVFALLIAAQLLGGFGRRCGFFLLRFQQVNL